MVIVRAVQRLGVQCDARIGREGLEPLLHQFGVESADLVPHKLGLEHQKWTAGDVDRNAGQCLVHRDMNIGVARDALHVAERLLKRLAQRNPDIFGGVVMIDVQVALGPDRHIDARMPREEIEHMVEKSDSGRDRCAAGPIEIDFNLDISFLGLALNDSLAHAEFLYARAFYQGFTGFATAGEAGLQLHRGVPR